MDDLLFLAWFAVAILAPVPAGIWAYRRSDRRPLLVIPLAVILIPIAWGAAIVLVHTALDAGYAPWTRWVPQVATTLVVVEGVRRLERELS